MKVKDLIAEDIDIDVCDDYDERCWIAKCGAYRLTDAAEQKFHEALDIPVYMTTGRKTKVAILHCESEREAEKCREFFFSLAGYCAAEDYDRWFVEV